MGEVLMKHLTAQPEVDQLPAPFPDVIRKALAKDPKDRYQTVDEMAQDVLAAEHVQESLAGFNLVSLTAAARVAFDQAKAREGAKPAIPARAGSSAEGNSGQGDKLHNTETRTESGSSAAHFSGNARSSKSGWFERTFTIPRMIPEDLGDVVTRFFRSRGYECVSGETYLWLFEKKEELKKRGFDEHHRTDIRVAVYDFPGVQQLISCCVQKLDTLNQVKKGREGLEAELDELANLQQLLADVTGSNRTQLAIQPNGASSGE